ncbi:MAG: ubiquitin-like domain-containing protein [Anaerolineaceae bacterium]
MNKVFGFLISGLLIFTGLVLIYFGINRPVTILVDGEPTLVWTRALTVAQALNDANIPIWQTDQLEPMPGAWLGWTTTITLTPSRQVSLWNGDKQAWLEFWSIQRLPGNLLAAAGIPASPVSVEVNGSKVTFNSAAASLGEVLWEHGYQMAEGDSVSQSLESPLPLQYPVSVHRALPLTMQVGSKKISILSAADTVGQALAQSGIALEGLDYSKPAEDQPLPENGQIKVVHVQEQVTLEQKQIPYSTEFVADPQTELDQSRVIDAGQVGIELTRLRVRYEDGLEVEKTTEAQWTASQPRNRKVGYGTKVVVRSLDTPDGKIQYWRAITVYATAYSPCGLGNVAKCYYGTSSGLPVQRGVIAVIYKWYLLMGGQPVYVPGYGKAVIADVGGGIPGKNWIDLGFTDADLEEWHQNVTLYFLTPVPVNIPWLLP